MTLTELQDELDKRGISMTLWQSMPDYSVWLFCADDPELGIFPGRGSTIEDAVGMALADWDKHGPEAEKT